MYLEPSDPKLPTWEYKGVKYRGSKPDAQEKFLKDPDKYAKAAEKQRFVNNFMQSMSTVWCPVTDEITPGGMTQWKRFGLTFESCCTFCDESFEEDNFARRAEEAQGTRREDLRPDRGQVHRRRQEPRRRRDQATGTVVSRVRAGDRTSGTVPIFRCLVRKMGLSPSPQTFCRQALINFTRLNKLRRRLFFARQGKP